MKIRKIKKGIKIISESEENDDVENENQTKNIVRIQLTTLKIHLSLALKLL